MRLLTLCPFTALKLAGKSPVVQIESTIYLMTYMDVKKLELGHQEGCIPDSLVKASCWGADA